MSKNQGIVRVREERECHICGSRINKGDQCYTINPRYGKRRWVCMECIGCANNDYVDDIDWDDGKSSNGL